MDLLRALYNGNIAPCETFGCGVAQNHPELGEGIIRLEQELLDSFTEKQREQFMKLREDTLELESYEAEQTFVKTFRLAFNLALEILNQT